MLFRKALLSPSGMLYVEKLSGPISSLLVRYLILCVCRYKGWGALLGQSLEENGIVVACLDYRYAG